MHPPRPWPRACTPTLCPDRHAPPADAAPQPPAARPPTLCPAHRAPCHRVTCLRSSEFSSRYRGSNTILCNSFSQVENADTCRETFGRDASVSGAEPGARCSGGRGRGAGAPGLVTPAARSVRRGEAPVNQHGERGDDGVHAGTLSSLCPALRLWPEAPATSVATWHPGASRLQRRNDVGKHGRRPRAGARAPSCTSPSLA